MSVVKARKKPIEVEAFQMTKERRWDNSDWPVWLHQAWQKDPQEGSFWCNTESPHEELYLGTLEGIHEVSWGDWIVKGVEDELYPVKPGIFEKTYEILS